MKRIKHKQVSERKGERVKEMEMEKLKVNSILLLRDCYHLRL